MKIEKLDHVNLRTTRLSVMTDWYDTVLGLRAGPRPAFPFAGAWLYAGDRAVVHLVEIDAPNAIGSEAPLKLEHFAFTASGIDGFEEKLQANGVQYAIGKNDLMAVIAFNIWDPDGNHIHVDFATA